MKFEKLWMLLLTCLLVLLVGCDEEDGDGGGDYDPCNGSGPLAQTTVDGNDTEGDLDEIINCGVIGMTLQISGTNLESLDELYLITQVDGDLSIHGNDVLTSFGLSSLTSVTGDVWIYENANLCQDLVDAFIAGLTIGGSVQNNYSNNGGC